MNLDDLGILAGTDKTSLAQGYLPHYERLFGQWRDREFNLIEIGIADGASLRCWAGYFPQAKIVGIDVLPDCERHRGDRVVVRIGSQADRAFLEQVAREFPPLLAIDDGSHRADHQIASFEALFPLLLPGGCYVCEDLTHANGTAYFADIARAMLGRPPAGSAAAGLAHCDIVPGMIALWKRADDPLAGLAHRSALVDRSERVAPLIHLANFLLRHGDVAAAVASAKRAVARAANNPWANFELARALDRAGDREGALVAAKHAATLQPQQPVFADFLRKLRQRAHPS